MYIVSSEIFKLGLKLLTCIYQTRSPIMGKTSKPTKSMNSFTNIPKDFLNKWQEIANLLAKVIAVPAALIMKTENEFMEVFISSQSENNPYNPGDKEKWYGLYCETVIKSQKELHIPNALKDKDWDQNPDIKLGMIAYLGLPINFPDNTPFGTICVLDNKEKHFSKDQEKLLVHFKTVIELDLALIQSLNVNKTENTIKKLLLKNKELTEAKNRVEENEKELQYKTEEYETINEELRQTNEELFQAKENAEESKNNWQTTFDAIEDIVMLLSVDHDIIEINKAGLKSLNLLKEEITGKKCFHIVHNTSKPILECPCETTINEKKTVHKEYRLNNRTYRLTAYPVINNNNEVTHFTHIVKDITDVKIKEAKISGLSKIIENSLNEITIFDKETFNFKFANNGALKNIGYTMDELGKMKPTDLNPGFTTKQFNELTAPLIKGETEIIQLESILQRKDGSKYDVLINLQLSEYEDEEVFVAFVSDISQQKKIEREINRQKKLFETMFNTIQEGVVITNTEREILLANKGMFRTFGYHPKDLIGKKTKILYADTDKFEEAGNTLFKKNVPLKDKNYLTYYKSKSNKIFPGETFGAKLYDDNGEWIGNIGIMRDISEREKFINDLKVAKERAEEANRLKTRFINNMSHEIRTPMNGIIGFSSLLDNPGIKEEKRKYYSKIIQSSSHQLLRIIDDILEISNLETRQVKLKEEKINLNDFVLEMFSIFNLKAKERNIPLYVKKALPDNQSHIISDQTKLNRILSNLIENALKFTNDGFVEIGYQLKEKNIVIYVKDTGIGISANYHEKIFDRFAQEEKEKYNKQGGLGLGLTISKENAELLGGNITVESEKGKGTTFYVTIPYLPANEKTSEYAEKSSENKRDKSKKQTILIAEDEEINYLYLEALFEKETETNYNLIHAKNGKEAVDFCLANNDIGLVLMDIKMPEMNGHEATEKIKAQRPNLPIIAQTAYSTEADKELAFKHGCDDFISKPIDTKTLMQLTNKYLDASQPTVSENE